MTIYDEQEYDDAQPETLEGETDSAPADRLDGDPTEDDSGPGTDDLDTDSDGEPEADDGDGETDQAGPHPDTREIAHSAAQPVSMADGVLDDRDRDVWSTYYALIRGH